jgi:hypothetical protein
MTHKFSLIILFALALMSPQLASCSELAAYPVKDSGLFAPDTAHVMWLDNSRVVFNGYTGVEYATDEPNRVVRFRDVGYYVWDIETGTIQRDTSLKDKGKICIRGNYWSYIRQSKEDEKEFVLVSGKKEEEIERSYPKVHWFNPHSCRYYETKPFWIVEGHQTIPLLEEHGYLDLGTRPETNYLTLRLENPNPAISFYSAEAMKSFTLPIGWLESRILQVHYAPFSNTYLLSGLQYYDDKRGFLPAWPDDAPLRVWWLSPDGILKKQEVPNPPWMHDSYFSFVPTRTGLLIVKHSTAGTERPGTIGGYLVRGQEVKKVVVGLLHKVAISPDGCTAAVVNDMYEKKPVSERTRLQIIQLCQRD